MDAERRVYAWPASGERPAVAPRDVARAPERRLQVRAYNYWARMLGSRRFPSVANLCRGELKDVGPRAVLLDLSSGGSPGIAFLGEQLAQESGLDATTLQRLSDAPAGSLLGRLGLHHQQAVTAGSPSGFEASFTGLRGKTVLYRGIMLPFSSDDETIDYVLAVVSWKEEAPGPVADIVASPEAKRAPRAETMLAGWADGPVCDSASDLAQASPLAFSGPGDPVEQSAPEQVRGLSEIARCGPEYALVMIRRTAGEPMALVGEVPHDPALLAEARRRLAG